MTRKRLCASVSRSITSRPNRLCLSTATCPRRILRRDSFLFRVLVTSTTSAQNSTDNFPERRRASHARHDQVSGSKTTFGTFGQEQKTLVLLPSLSLR